MLILLPPSEGKWSPVRGKPLDVQQLDFSLLNEARDRVRSALVELCRGDLDQAMGVLGLSHTQVAHVVANRDLDAAPTARADRVYSGVLFEALDPVSLSSAAKRRASSRVAIASALFGLVRAGDRIPAYRLSGDVSLPSLGPVAKIWRESYPAAVGAAVGSGVLVDARSGTYASFWRPTGAYVGRCVTLRVLTEQNGKRTTVSHANKATKGRLVRALLEDGGNPSSVHGFAELVGDLGWRAELTAQANKPAVLDVIVEHV